MYTMSINTENRIESCNDSIGSISFTNESSDSEVKSTDNSANQPMDQLPGIKYNPNRRSQIFQKRPVELDVSSSNGSNDGPVLSQEDDLIISASPRGDLIPFAEYMKRLKDENEGWNSLRMERKEKYKEAIRHQLEPLTLESCADVLSEENKKFIRDKPDYEAIALSVKHLAEMAVIGEAIKHSALMKARYAVEGVEERLKTIEEKIVNRS